MRYFAFATDYDGTLATDGKVSPQTLEALQRLQESGRKLLLVTGRHLDDLRSVFPELDRFDAIVAENGASLYFPASRETQLLGDRPPAAFIQALKDRNVQPLGVGEVIVSTWEPHETTVLEVIRDLGLELQVIFNKGAVMVLPSGINKAVGLKAALTQLGLSPYNTVAIGDAENDHAFLEVCECGVAVANALPMLKDRADWVTQESRGDGVIEFINRMLETDLQDFSLKRHQILLGTRDQDEPVMIQPTSMSILLAGMSGGGKSTLATGILERLAAEGYQFCIIDPEGDYESFGGAIVLGNGNKEPGVSEILEVLKLPNQSVIVNLLGVKLDRRPEFFAGLFPALLELRSQTGRPHWLVVDEAHHLLPSTGNLASIILPQAFKGLMLITVHPDHVALSALSLMDGIIAVGQAPQETIATFCQTIQHCPPELGSWDLEPGTAIAWFPQSPEFPFQFQITPPQMERHRHMRNYAEGELGDDKCFYFRGAEAKLNLKAQNLMRFAELAAGVDEETWLFHLQQQDYSRWFQEAIKDPALAAVTTEVELTPNISASESRDRIKAAIEQRYTLPA